MGERKITCNSCGGSGQISFFQGVSRFLLTVEECHECGGLGYLVEKNGGKNCSPEGKKGKTRKKG